MAAVATRVADKRMLKLIRAFLEAGVMENGLVSPVDEGTPQGGPLLLAFDNDQVSPSISSIRHVAANHNSTSPITSAAFAR